LKNNSQSLNEVKYFLYKAAGFMPIGIGLSVFFWLFESWIHTSRAANHDLLHEITRPGIHEIWMRSLVCFIIICFFVYAQIIIKKLTRTKARLQDLSCELEHRVRERTAELETANKKLQGEIEERIASERALQISERSLRESQEVGNVGSWSLDLLTNEERWSDQIYRLLDLKPEEVKPCHEKFLGAIHPEDRETVKTAIHKTINENESYEAEFRVVRRDGTECWIHSQGGVQLDNTGKPIKLVGIHQDITERKKADEAIRRQSQLLDSIRSAQSIFITGADPKPVFEALLKTLVEITDSEYGFLDEVYRDENDRLYKRSLALSDISWDEKSRKLYEQLKASNMEFQNLNNLAGAPAKTGELVISNKPAGDSRSGSIPEGHPPIRAFMGIPMFFGGELVGVAGVANRDGGYNEEIVSSLDTFIATCASIIQAIRDDLERQKIAKKLAESEEKYRRIIEDQMEFVVRWLPDGTRTFVNNSYCRYYGISNDEAIGTSFFPLITEDYREEIRKRIESVTPENPVLTNERKVIRPDGTIGWNQWTDRAFFDKEGKLIEFQSLGQDVTERKKAEEQLAIFKKFAESSTQGFGMADLEGHLIYCNDTLCHDFLGEEDPQKALGKNISCYYDEKSAKYLQEQILPHVLEAGQWAGEISLVSVDGKITESIQSIFLIRNNKGEPTYFANVATDITERRQLEEQAKVHQTELAHVSRLSAVGEMASGLAHELNQPLCAIQSRADLCLRALDDKNQNNDKIKENLKIIEGQAERAGNVIRRIKAFVKKREPNRSSVDINNIVRETLAFADSEIRNNNVKVCLDLSGRIPLVLADRVQIEQVLLNLIRNAVEAMAETPQEERNLTIQISRDSDNKIKVAVRDNGEGLTSEVEEHLFDAFFTTKPNDLGIGLSISRSIINVHQGDLWGQRNPDGDGSTFTFTLPVSEPMVCS